MNIFTRLARFYIAIALVGSGFIANAATAQTPTQPTLIIDFDNDINGIAADGTPVKPRLEGEATFQEGKTGKAFKSGPGAGYLYFPTEGIFTAEAGTVEMWVQPIDWSGTEKSFHSFFRVKGDGELHLYKYFNEMGLLFLSNDGQPGSKNRIALKNVDSWKPGEWHHIAATWSAARQTLYIDGQAVSSAVPGIPQSLGKEFLIGDHPFNPAIARTSQSLIDGVRLYDRALSAEAIAAHFEGNYEKATPLTEKTAVLDYHVNRSAETITTTLTLQGADVDTKTSLVDFALLQKERTAAQQPNRPFSGTVASGDFSTSVPAGEYILRATLHDNNGKTLGTLERDLTIPSLEWLGNTIGKEKKVLSPWTPLEVQHGANGFAVKSWAREYHFGNNLLPVQITAKDAPMLSAPLNLKVLLDDKPLQWTNARTQIKGQSGYEVNITGSAEALTPSGRITAESTIHIEYDGLMWIGLRLLAPSNFQPQAITLDIPMREQNALYRHNWSGGSKIKSYSGALPVGSGILQHNAFQPLSWLGDNDRGLFWFCETAQQWPNWNSDNAFQLERQSGIVTTRLDLLRGQALPGQWHFEFGLQATPVKPLPKDWRKWRFSSAPSPTAVVPWPSDKADSTRYFGYPEAANADEYQKMLDAEHARGRAVIPYLLLNGISGGAPEWKWFVPEWDLKSDELGGKEAPLHHMAPTVPSWQDFVIWKTKQFNDRFNIGGAYHDLTYAYGWAVPSANTGWFDGKEWHKTYPIRAYRELYRRNYALFKESKPNSFLWGHNSPVMVIPMLAYEDAYLNGETLLGPLKGKTSYLDVMGLDQWRVEYTGRQWGVIPFILPEFRDEAMRAIEPTRGLATLAMLHDTSVWPIWSNGAVWKKVYDALDAFGYEDSTFIPYWAENPPATTAMQDVYISVYKRDDGRALAIIGNTAKEARSGTVKLDAKAIGLSTDHVISWPDKKPVTQENGQISIALDGLDYRMLLIGPAP